MAHLGGSETFIFTVAWNKATSVTDGRETKVSLIFCSFVVINGSNDNDNDDGSNDDDDNDDDDDDDSNVDDDDDSNNNDNAENDDNDDDVDDPRHLAESRKPGKSPAHPVAE